MMTSAEILTMVREFRSEQIEILLLSVQTFDPKWRTLSIAEGVSTYDHVIMAIEEREAGKDPDSRLAAAREEVRQQGEGDDGSTD